MQLDARELLSAVPFPVALMLGFFLFIILLIADTGAGAPIYWPFVRPFCRPFRPTPAYQRIKSKYSLST